MIGIWSISAKRVDQISQKKNEFDLIVCKMVKIGIGKDFFGNVCKWNLHINMIHFHNILVAIQVILCVKVVVRGNHVLVLHFY